MYLQDIPMNTSTKAQVMLDNGSELTIVSSFFTKRNNLTYEDTTYTLTVVGGAATSYNAGEGDKIYTVPLMSSSGELVTVKVFSVENILIEKITREEIKFNPEKFPHLSQDI